MKLLCSCADPSEAEAIRLRLDAAGIEALVAGVDQIHFGLEFSGAKVEVAGEDYQRARQILLDDLRRIEQAGPWICCDCEEQNDAAFEICWHCHKPRDEKDERVLADEEVESLPPPTVQPVAGAAVPHDSNPYRPTLVSEDATAPFQRPRSYTREAIGWILVTLLIVFLLTLLLG